MTPDNQLRRTPATTETHCQVKCILIQLITRVRAVSFASATILGESGAPRFRCIDLRRPGSLAASANASVSIRTRSAINRNSPPTRVVNSRDESVKSPTLATASALGPTRPGRSSSSLDFHSVPYFGEHPLVQSHYLAKRSRRQPSILTFLAQDADSHVFCYANADIRKGEEADEVFRFINFWKRQYGRVPQHLVFDSKLTTYEGLDRLDAAGITFMTLRRRTKGLLADVDGLPPSAWRTVTLDLPHRKYRTPRIYEQKVRLRERSYRQLFIKDLGHDEPTILITNDAKSSARNFITRYAKRMLIENALADAVRFFHIDALSSSVGFKVDFDMALLVLASALEARRPSPSRRAFSFQIQKAALRAGL